MKEEVREGCEGKVCGGESEGRDEGWMGHLTPDSLPPSHGVMRSNINAIINDVFELNAIGIYVLMVF